jgi:6-phosphogluconate dehydrogenase
MKLGFVGLGKMGKTMVLSLCSKGFEVIAYDISASAVEEVAKKGAKPAFSLEELAKKLESPRTVWLMVPAGKPADNVIEELLPHLSEGDTLIDGGNSYYKDSQARAEKLSKHSINFIDIGTSGGLEGAEKGLSLTIGGEEEPCMAAEPLFKALAAPNGYFHTGPVGSGHFVKMIHNGIEYALLQAYGEGFELLKSGPYKLDLPGIARVWNSGAVIRSWILELLEEIFKEDPQLERIVGEVGGGETGQWTVKTAMERKVPVPLISLALLMRYRSRQKDTFAGKVVAVLRNRFGGHEIKLK